MQTFIEGIECCSFKYAPFQNLHTFDSNGMQIFSLILLICYRFYSITFQAKKICKYQIKCNFSICETAKLQQISVIIRLKGNFQKYQPRLLRTAALEMFGYSFPIKYNTILLTTFRLFFLFFLIMGVWVIYFLNAFIQCQLKLGRVRTNQQNIDCKDACNLNVSFTGNTFYLFVS